MPGLLTKLFKPPTREQWIDMLFRAGQTFFGTVITLWPSTQVLHVLASSDDFKVVVDGLWVVLAPVVIAAGAATYSFLKTYISNMYLGTGTATLITAPASGLPAPQVTPEALESK